MTVFRVNGAEDRNSFPTWAELELPHSISLFRLQQPGEGNLAAVSTCWGCSLGVEFTPAELTRTQGGLNKRLDGEGF